MGFSPPVVIDMTAIGEREYRFTRCNRLWLPKTIVLGGAVVQNPATDAVLGVRVNERSQEMLPFATKDGYVLNIAGDMTSIWVTVLQKGAANTLYLATGTDVGVAYGNVDGLSPNVAGSSAGFTIPSTGRGGAPYGGGPIPGAGA